MRSRGEQGALEKLNRWLFAGLRRPLLTPQRARKEPRRPLRFVIPWRSSRVSGVAETMGSMPGKGRRRDGGAGKAPIPHRGWTAATLRPGSPGLRVCSSPPLRLGLRPRHLSPTSWGRGGAPSLAAGDSSPLDRGRGGLRSKPVRGCLGSYAIALLQRKRWRGPRVLPSAGPRTGSADGEGVFAAVRGQDRACKPLGTADLRHSAFFFVRLSPRLPVLADNPSCSLSGGNGGAQPASHGECGAGENPERWAGISGPDLDPRARVPSGDRRDGGPGRGEGKTPRGAGTTVPHSQN